MCTINILAHCYDKFFEVIPEEKASAEFAVEELVNYVLIDLFGDAEQAYVEEVEIDFSQGLHVGLRHCTISIHAQCSCKTFVSAPCSHDVIRQAIKDATLSALKELFVTVKINDVILRHSLRKCELGSTYSYMV